MYYRELFVIMYNGQESEYIYINMYIYMYIYIDVYIKWNHFVIHLKNCKSTIL